MTQEQMLELGFLPIENPEKYADNTYENKALEIIISVDKYETPAEFIERIYAEGKWKGIRDMREKFRALY